MALSSSLRNHSNPESRVEMEVHPADQAAGETSSSPSQQHPNIIVTTTLLPQPQGQQTICSNMTAEAHPAYTSTLHFPEGHQDDKYFDHWFDGEHPQEEVYLVIRNSRPAFFRASCWTDGDGKHTWSEVHTQWFPHVALENNMTIMEMPTGQYLAGLYNLDGQIRMTEYLNDMSLMAGLRLAIGRLGNMVKITTAVLRGDLPASQWGDENTNLDDRRFTVIPVYFRFPSHWTVGISDQVTASFYFFDSLVDERSRRAKMTLDLINKLRTRCGRSDSPKDLELHIMDLPQQQRSWNCGLLALENVRVFFREHQIPNNDSQHTLSINTHPWVISHTWPTSAAHHGRESSQVEATMISLWLTAIRRELGSPIDIRYPPTPGVSFTTTDRNGIGADEPNSFWIDEAKGVSSPNMSHCDKPANTPPGIKADGSHHSPLTSLECIDWEQALNIELLRRMQTIYQILEKRYTKYKIQIGNNSFLGALKAAMSKWLREVEAEAKASEEDLVNFGGIRYCFELARDPKPPDGKMLCAALVRDIRRYEAEWKTAFDKGNDPDATTVPYVTKETLARIIRQCLVVKGNGKQRYSSKWLRENVGSRFFTNPERGNEYSTLRLAHDGLTQADLGCTDKVWSSLKPKHTKQLKPFRSPRYFAPVPSLMRARHALKSPKAVTSELPGLTEGDGEMGVREEIWTALNALPPKFLGFLKKYELSGLGRIIDMMTILSLHKDKNQFVRNWNLILSNSIDAPESVSKGEVKRRKKKEQNKRKKQRDVNMLTKIMLREPRSLQKVLELGNGYPDLMDPLLEAYYNGCPVANASLDLVALLACGDKRIRRHKNQDILTVEDVVSILPGKTMTATAMYRTIERITLKHDQATMIPPAILEAWAEGRKNTGLLRNLAQKFKPDTEDIVLPKTIYILPQVEVVEGFAICSVTLTYCSTLLIGTEEAIVELEKFLRSLFKTLFPTKPPEYSWWSSEFSWNRFCRLSIQVKRFPLSRLLPDIQGTNRFLRR